MRAERKEAILALIERYAIDTQDELVEKLRGMGFKVTQSTVSRDIKELKLVKTSSGGVTRYALAQRSGQDEQRFANILKNTVTSVEYSGNIKEIKTLSGCENAAAEALDSSPLEGILGTIAGDNTVFVVARSADRIPEMIASFRELIKQ